MLILSRRPDQSVVIGGNIEVKVVSVRGRSVRLGVSAPAGVVVDRGEVHSRKVMEDQIEREIDAALKEMQGSKNSTF